MSNWTDQATPTRKGEELDKVALETYLAEQLPDHGPLTIRQFPSGFSNLTYLLQLGDKEFVLRRPPFGANIKSGHDMFREYRILSHLKEDYPKVPAPVLYCEDQDVIGAPFYIMERMKGVILRAKMPPEMVPEPDKMNRIADALVATMVELHQVDYKSIGLADLGRPEGYNKRQIKGWTKRYLRAKTNDLENIAFVAKWLDNNLPKEVDGTLIHNDFKYDNLVLDPKNWSEVIAILDWEMATLGDPLMDLGTSLGYWVNPDDPPFMQQLKLSPTTLPGNPSREELASLYAQKSGRNIDHLVFYYVYGLFKIAVIIQQIYARYKKGHTKDPRFSTLIEGVKGCGLIARQAITKQKLDHLF